MFTCQASLLPPGGPLQYCFWPHKWPAGPAATINTPKPAQQCRLSDKQRCVWSVERWRPGKQPGGTAAEHSAAGGWAAAGHQQPAVHRNSDSEQRTEFYLAAAHGQLPHRSVPSAHCCITAQKQCSTSENHASIGRLADSLHLEHDHTPSNLSSKWISNVG